MDIFIYLDDIADGLWTADHPEAVARLPEGYRYTWAGASGAWAERVE